MKQKRNKEQKNIHVHHQILLHNSHKAGSQYDARSCVLCCVASTQAHTQGQDFGLSFRCVALQHVYNRTALRNATQPKTCASYCEPAFSDSLGGFEIFIHVYIHVRISYYIAASMAHKRVCNNLSGLENIFKIVILRPQMTQKHVRTRNPPQHFLQPLSQAEFCMCVSLVLNEQATV